MPVEIERKFLVVGDDWRHGDPPGQRFCQGYLAGEPGVTVRIRRAGAKAYITIKGKPVGSARSEFEYEIPVEEAEMMLKELCRRPLIEKTRHEVVHAGHLWEVDEFAADNAGLVTAEVELDHPNEPVELPPWVGKEVTLDPRYSNSALAASPIRAARST